MPSSPAASGSDFFLTRKARVPRGRGRASTGPGIDPARAPRQAEAEGRRLLDDRQRVIRGTLASNAFEVVFQPIVDLQTGRAVGAEALTRFEASPMRPPDVWFAEAAAVGLGVELEMATIRSALGQLRRLPSGRYLSLNASPVTMMSADFRATLADVPAERVVLELTGHEGIGDDELFGKAVSELRSEGARLAVDDTGGGFSSFRHIFDLHPDVIKLDMGLTRGIDGNAARHALGSALLTFGLDTFDFTLVAEGIESEDEFRALRGLGCRFGQGFYLGRPSSLYLPRLQPDDSEPHLLRSERRSEPTLPSSNGAVGNEVNHDSPRDTPVSGQRTPASDTTPGQLEARPDHVLVQERRPQTAYDEFLDLIAEIQQRTEDRVHATKGHCPFVRLLFGGSRLRPLAG